MVVMYFQTESGIKSETLCEHNLQLLANALWIDMLSPTKEEEKIVEKELQFEIPTKMEMEEIEPSSRLYVDNRILYMTATIVAQSSQPAVKTDVATFILTEEKLITIRYSELYAFDLFIAKFLRSKAGQTTAVTVLIEILDAAADRLADILEKISHTFDEISHHIFRQNSGGQALKDTNYKKILQSIGSNGDLGTKAGESLVSLTRLISFLEQSCGSKISKEQASSLTILSRDIAAINDYTNFLSTKFNFLLDATLGMINIEQNNIIKIFSVVAVVFLPPTLIASIYGMNFNHMPELGWHVGYPIALILMVLSAWIPLRYFKKKKWF